MVEYNLPRNLSSAKDKRESRITVNRSRRGDSLATKDKSFFGHIRKSIEFDRIQLAGAMRCYVKLEPG